MHAGDVTSFGDPYQWQLQGIKTTSGIKVSRIVCAAVIDGVGKNEFDLFIYPTTSIAVKADFPRIPVVIPQSATLLSASLRVPSSPIMSEFSVWGQHISSNCNILSGATDALSLCWKSATGINLNSSVKIAANSSGIIPKASSIRFNQSTAIPNILGSPATVDGVVSLKNLVSAGNALSSNLIRLSLSEQALLIVDLAVSLIDDAVQYDDVPGISRRDIFI